MKRRVRCKNGNWIERFYDRRTRSSVVVVKDNDGNQIGEADYDGNQISHRASYHLRINENGGVQ